MKKVFLGLVALLILTGGGCVVAKNDRSEENTSPTEPVMCTMDAKQCPDGSYVGRSGPKCEFAKCP
ncbi:MAG: Uncharacterized protein G01um101413_82 [Parcubacteria group bacterium Gr01-1014_13]|nr:MAG: Uncharacterized protein G01um101413_82 [Parcubacteria group bacterium Gr01-1014_13]